MSTDKTLLQRIPLRVRVLGGALLLSVALALIGGSKTPLQTGIWIFIALLLLGFVGLVALGLFWPGGKRKEKKTSEPEHPPTPAATPAAAGAGHHGHDDHGHGESHGHDHGHNHHGLGCLGWSVVGLLIAAAVLAFVLWFAGAAKKVAPPATVVRHPPASAADGKRKLTDPPFVRAPARVLDCSTKPEADQVREILAPADGCSEVLDVTDSYSCFNPGPASGRIKVKLWYAGEDMPSDDGWKTDDSGSGTRMCIASTSGKDLTVRFWTVPLK